MARFFIYLFLACAASIYALQFDPAHVDFNLNQNKSAFSVLDYAGQWENHTFQPSPENWRFPIYTTFLDRFANGDPSNDNANGTAFEQDLTANQLRHGGDILGLRDSLDYLQGMGIKAIYIAGSPFINQPWGADAYSPLDLSLLDRHFGSIQDWRTTIDEIHRRSMYIVLDNTFSTLGDLLTFDGFENSTAPYKQSEYLVKYKTDRVYHDFTVGDRYLNKCQYPRIWGLDGLPLPKNFTDEFQGCYDSEFNQYGVPDSSKIFPDYKLKFTKFAGVQDRLREWRSDVLAKIQRFSCLTIQMLDIDGYRLDKASQINVDALGDWSQHMRQCARSLGKDNFFIMGEVISSNPGASVYIGRGRQPDMVPDNITQALSLGNSSSDAFFIRAVDKNGLDGTAFHYITYRALERFLGLDGRISDDPAEATGFVELWNNLLLTNDFINPNTGLTDPRHMFGATNQDVLRWPAIRDGTDKQMLGLFITTLLMPGIPAIYWGEEQDFYLLDSTATNYVFGRQPMTSTEAWQMHGCYRLGSSQFPNLEADRALAGCSDEINSFDRRDPAHPLRNIISSMFQMRSNYPVLNDGLYLEELAKKTRLVQLPFSEQTPTEVGIWSVGRGPVPSLQNLGPNNQPVWLVYHNDNVEITYEFDCADEEMAFIAPYPAGTAVKNLFYPFDEQVLEPSTRRSNFSATRPSGCLPKVEMRPWGYKAYVPTEIWAPPSPVVTRFSPGHDARVLSRVGPAEQDILEIEIQFSDTMDCARLADAIKIESVTEPQNVATLDKNSVQCLVNQPPILSQRPDGFPGVFSFKANLRLTHGVHTVIFTNATTADGLRSTNSVDRFYIRFGAEDNPVVFPKTANYSNSLLQRNSDDKLFISHKAPGANKFRYSLNWGTSYSNWEDYKGGNTTLSSKVWSGTKQQQWTGEHVIVQYWTQIGSSSSHIQHGDLDFDLGPRRFPHIFANGPFNKFGFDGGLGNKFSLGKDGTWKFNIMTEWPTELQINVWGMNPDGRPDQTAVFGDVDFDGTLDRLPPNSLTKATVNISRVPPGRFLAYRLELDDGSLQYQLTPVGSQTHQMIIYFLFWIIPVLSGALVIYGFMKSFYQVKFNQFGNSVVSKFPFAVPAVFGGFLSKSFDGLGKHRRLASSPPMIKIGGSVFPVPPSRRRKVLIATMEYDIEDWAIKVKIGGLGVMAQLMGKSLGHQDLIWVVPCVGGIDFPLDQPADPMKVTILNKEYEIQVQYHVLRNITYVLLDTSIFRKQTKSEPYPPRMDDLESAIYYSAWNQCIALTMQRFSVDLYHINDYHGAIAPLYLLPQTIPCCLSMHNAEFQGLWPMRSANEKKEVCSVYNLPEDVVQKYVQYGDVFNLLHAGASYLRIHQKGFGAVGVSKKYGARSWARYPIFWGLPKIGQLPNPDPTDTADLLQKEMQVMSNPEFEAARQELKRQAQEWAKLNQDPEAELFVFVGRWSLQKGVDLIADIFPAVLEENPKVQLLCVGPVIDLYGKFAALKLGVLMEKYPGRVFSKPEFTALPPCIFSGAEFALIPSRDEPFGLVAVEFGRKGALGVGALVGGLGQMPGWWYTIESTTSTHLIRQFKKTVKEALASNTETRAMLRARSAVQRFPVAQWVADLGKLQDTSIKIHDQQRSRSHRGRFRLSELEPTVSRSNSPQRGRRQTRSPTPIPSIVYELPSQFTPPPPDTQETLSLGVRAGPGHTSVRRPTREVDFQPIMELSESDTTSVYEEEYTMSANALPRGNDLPWNIQPDASRRNSEQSRSPLRRDITPDSYHSPSRSAEADSERLLGHHLETKHNYSSQYTPYRPAASLKKSPSLGNRLARMLTMRKRGPSPPALSFDSVTGGKDDFKLQNVEATFEDSQETYYNAFADNLRELNSKNSEDALCIEEYLKKSEKKWYAGLRAVKLGKSRSPSPARYGHTHSRNTSVSSFQSYRSTDTFDGDSETEYQGLLPKDYTPPRGLRKIMQYRIADWPVYSLLIALGQLLAANSYQVTLLVGSTGQSELLFYLIVTIYILSSAAWYFLYRRFKAIYVLSLPFLLYGLAFFFVGLSSLVGSMLARTWLQNVATGVYAIASSSGSIFFALNFGDDGGSPIKSWVYRASIIQGSQQIYAVVLWYWGSRLTQQMSAGMTNLTPVYKSPTLAAITIPIAALLAVISRILYKYLPDYYHQSPGSVPSFYKSLIRRKIILWFFVTVVIQNFWLSGPYGRSWEYLWSSKHAPAWAILILVIVFFIGVWAGFLTIFGILSKEHSWIIPIFAIGLGAPRWCQILWGTSNIGQYVPWAGGPMGSALAGRALWLWLGTLDSLQGVGFGMILLQTLTRTHISFTLSLAQVLGGIAAIIARASALDSTGPGRVFPNFSFDVMDGLKNGVFWVGLLSQIAICVGFMMFFRKEQLSKP